MPGKALMITILSILNAVQVLVSEHICQCLVCLDLILAMALTTVPRSGRELNGPSLVTSTSYLDLNPTDGPTFLFLFLFFLIRLPSWFMHNYSERPLWECAI